MRMSGQIQIKARLGQRLQLLRLMVDHESGLFWFEQASPFCRTEPFIPQFLSLIHILQTN